jgi:hypothetical protein
MPKTKVSIVKKLAFAVATLLLVSWLLTPAAGAAKPATLKVMTQNLYIGADLGIFSTVTSPAQIPPAMTQFYAQVQATNFPARAEKIADEIAANDPELVSLNEATLWRSQTPSDFSTHPTPNATTVEADYIQILLDKLSARGKHYAAVVTGIGVDREFPRITDTGLQDIRWTDRDAILARTDLPTKNFSVTNPQSQRFTAEYSTTIGPLHVTFPRTWNSVDIVLHDQTIRFVNTHLDPVDPTTQIAQGAELLSGPLNTSLPTVLAGDLNSAADSATGVPGHTNTPTYANLIAGGMTDSWLTTHQTTTGLTCCQHPDLLSDPASYVMRIDYVLSKGSIAAKDIFLVGNTAVDKTPSGLWPSDHAGLAAVLHATG